MSGESSPGDPPPISPSPADGDEVGGSSPASTIAPTPPGREIVPHSDRGLLHRLLTLAGVGPVTAAGLEKAEVVDRLRLHSKELVDLLYSISLGVLESDAKRGATLDSKATSLLGAVGLSVTVVFTFGGSLLEHPRWFSGLGAHTYQAMVVLYALALLLGLAGSLLALRALRIRDHRAIDERDFLSREVLAEADVEETGVCFYKRYLIAHHIEVSHGNCLVYESKARLIKLGQRLFFGFLVVLLVIGATHAASALRPLHRDTPGAAQTGTASTSGDLAKTNLSAGAALSPAPSPPGPAPTSPTGQGASQSDLASRGTIPEEGAMATPPKAPERPPPPPPTPAPGPGKEVQADVKKPIKGPL